MSRSMFFQSHRSFVPRDYSRLRTERETRKDGRRGKLEADAGRNDAEVGRDIDDEEETGEHADAKDRELQDQYGENATQRQAGTPRAGQREQDAARQAPENQRRVQGRRQNDSRPSGRQTRHREPGEEKGPERIRDGTQQDKATRTRSRKGTGSIKGR